MSSMALLAPTPLADATRGKLHQPAPAPAASGGQAGGSAVRGTASAGQPAAAEEPQHQRTRAAAPASATEPARAQAAPAERRAQGRPQARRGHDGEGTSAPAAKKTRPAASGEAATPGGGAGTQSETGQASLTAAARTRHGKGGKAGREREAREARERGEQEKQKLEHEAQARVSRQRATDAAAAPVAASATTAVATTVPAAAPAPAAPVAPTVVSQHAVAASGPARRTAARAHTHNTATSTVAAARAPAAAAAASTQTPSATPPARHRSGSRPAAAAKQTPPTLITTVTKFINVVPAAMRWIIAALIALALALAVSSRVAALRARRLARQRRELLDDVGLLQAALLPTLPERVGEVAASAAYEPASGPGAGGDFYDVFALTGGQLGVIVGDVSGHGRSALPHTTLVRYTLRAYLEAGLSPRSALQTAAPVLERQLGDVFATVVLATYDPAQRTLVYASAGHPPPIVLGVDGSNVGEPLALMTRGSSPPIGAGHPTGRRQTIIALPGEAVVCFYTDGVVEARVHGALYGPRRLARALAALGPAAGADELLERVGSEVDRRPDDMAACVLHIDGAAAAPGVQVEELELEQPDAATPRLERFLLAGGLPPEQIEQVVGEVDGSLAQHGAVVLEMRRRAGAADVRLRRRRFAVLRPQISERPHDTEVTVA